MIQASLVDTWAATAAGAYTLTENSLYTTEAFGEYIDHLSDTGYLTITRWVFDGLRLVSLAQDACAARGLDAARHLAIVRFDRVATFLLKKTPFSEADSRRLTDLADELGFSVLYVPGVDRVNAEAESGRNAANRHERRRLSPPDPRARSPASSSRSTRSTSRRPPTTGRSSSTRLDFATSSMWHSAGRCCSATA